MTPLLTGYNEPSSPDYELSAEQELDRVYEDMRRQGLNPSDVFTLRLFLVELKKALKAGGQVWAAISLAISVLAKKKRDYEESNTNGQDPWPPKIKAPIRFGNPEQDLRGILLGRTKNATRFVEPNRKEYLKNNPPPEKG